MQVFLSNTWTVMGWNYFSRFSCPWAHLAAETAWALYWGLAVCSRVITSNGSTDRMGRRRKNITIKFILPWIGLKASCSLMINMVLRPFPRQRLPNLYLEYRSLSRAPDCDIQLRDIYTCMSNKHLTPSLASIEPLIFQTTLSLPSISWWKYHTSSFSGRIPWVLLDSSPSLIPSV